MEPVSGRDGCVSCFLSIFPQSQMSLSESTQHQYDALLQTKGLADFSSRTQLEIMGNDRAAFLNNFCTNDISSRKNGEGCEAFFTDVKGKVLAYASLFCTDNAIHVETVPDQAEMLIGHLDRYLIREDVELADRSNQWGQLIVSGKEVSSLLESLCGLKPPAVLWSHCTAELAGRTVFLRKVDYLGPTTWLVGCTCQEDVPVLIGTLTDAGAVACDREAIEMARIEAGTPYYGCDISDGHLPQEVDRNERAISFTKGCYLGQETVARLDALGRVNRALRAVQFDQSSVPPSGTTLHVEDRVVGEVTSAIFSSRSNSPLAMAYVRREYFEMGTKLASEFGSATIVEFPG